MDLLVLICALVLIGFIVYLLTTRVPMPAYWATAIQVIALVIVLLYVLTRFFRLPNLLQ